MFPDLSLAQQRTRGQGAKPDDRVCSYMVGLEMKGLICFFIHGDEQYK